jgi:hypothetical protein
MFMSNQSSRAALHKEMLCCIADFESLVAELGDSRPPITREDVIDIKWAIAILKALPAVRPMPVGDHGGAMVAQTILNRIASKSEGIGIVALPYWWDVALMRLIRSVTNWLH